MFLEVIIFIIAALGAFAFVRLLQRIFDLIFNSKK
jgi:hypothetical protein